MAKKARPKQRAANRESAYERRRKRYQQVMTVIGVLIILSMVIPSLLQLFMR